MPTLFDSHDEFNEWFSKDIENFAERQSGLDEGEYLGRGGSFESSLSGCGKGEL